VYERGDVIVFQGDYDLAGTPTDPSGGVAGEAIGPDGLPITVNIVRSVGTAFPAATGRYYAAVQYMGSRGGSLWFQMVSSGNVARSKTVTVQILETPFMV
jgi:hypothetical protein